MASTIANGESGLSVRTKYNAMAAEVNQNRNQSGYNAYDYNVRVVNTAAENATNLAAMAAALSDGDKIFFPEFGTYLCNNVNLTKRFIFDGNLATFETAANTPIFTVSSATAKGSIFMNMKFKGSGKDSGSTAQRGIYFNTSGQFNVHFCFFEDFGGAAVAVESTESATNLGGAISESTFFTNNYSIDLLNRGEYVRCDNNTIERNNNAFRSVAGNFTISDSQINRNTNAIEVASGTNNGHGIISNNHINHNTNYALNIHDTAYGMQINGNQIFEGIVRVADCSGKAIVFSQGMIDATEWQFVSNTSAVELQEVTFPADYTNTVSVTGANPTFFRCSGTLPVFTNFYNNNGAWIDYSATSTIVGWSAFTTKIIRYTVIGKVLICEFAIQGTSNATSTTFTLPFSNANFTSKPRGCYASNNGTPIATGGVAWVNSNSGTVTIYTDWALNAAWTGSGNKHIVGVIELEIA